MSNLDYLIGGANTVLTEKKYSRSTIVHHNTSWSRLRRWYKARGYERYDSAVQECYFEESGLNEKTVDRCKGEERNHIRRLLELERSGGFLNRESSARELSVPQGFASAYKEYEDVLLDRGLKRTTINGYMCTVRLFCSACNALEPKQLSVSSIASFAKNLEGYAAQTRSTKLYTVRDFTRFLADRGYCGSEVAACMPLIPGHKHSSVPSAYSSKELSLLLSPDATASHLQPKRDRAIMLLGGLIGMRVSDIKALTFEDIDWRSRTIRFSQRKTGVSQVLPMPEEAVLSLAEYLRDEQPDIDSGRVFITACAPYRPIDSTHVFHRSVANSFKAAGIDTAGKHHGMHSLRHSTATNLLGAGVPYPMISSVLGHSSTIVTKRYLSIDVESLRSIALEVPQWEG